MGVHIQQVDAEMFTQFDRVFALLKRSFAYMEDRIDPPSSLENLNVESIKTKAKEETLYILTVDDELAGCVFARVHDEFVYLGKLAIDSRFRGCGYARRLMEQVEVQAKNRGVGCVELETRVELTGNQRFFAKAGYYKIAENAHEGYDRPTSYRYRKEVILQVSEG